MESRPQDTNETARAYYNAMIMNGRIPNKVAGGPLDGLRHFEIQLDGVTYWITAYGMLDPRGL
jgi:hypothetical protein